MRALVIDDELLVLEGIEAFLQASLPDLTLDKTADVDTALRLAATVRYELVLLDWNLISNEGARVDGRAVVQALRDGGLAAPVLVVSGDDHLDRQHLVFGLGLAGFVSKSAPGSALLDAIQVALHGGVYLPQQIANRRIHGGRASHGGGAMTPVDLRARYPELTQRQAEVFAIMVRGVSDKQIARELSISEATVKSHVQAIFDVVGVRRRDGLLFCATGQKAGRG